MTKRFIVEFLADQWSKSIRDRLQEEVAAGTPAMSHIKLIQGLTLVVESTAEVPFMFLCGEWCPRCIEWCQLYEIHCTK